MSGSLFISLLAFGGMFALSAGIVLVLLGVRSPAVNVCKCGYSRAGLTPDGLCPECGVSREVSHRPRYIAWRIAAGVCLIVLAIVTFPLLLALLMGSHV